MTSYLFVTLILLLLCLCPSVLYSIHFAFSFIPYHHPSTCLFLLTSYPIPSALSSHFNQLFHSWHLSLHPPHTTQSLGKHVHIWSKHSLLYCSIVSHPIFLFSPVEVRVTNLQASFLAADGLEKATLDTHCKGNIQPVMQSVFGLSSNLNVQTVLFLSQLSMQSVSSFVPWRVYGSSSVLFYPYCEFIHEHCASVSEGALNTTPINHAAVYVLFD